MFIKLNFTSDKKLTMLFRVLADIINTSSVTSISALQTRATAASYDVGLLAGLDTATSEIIRTVDTTGVKAHYAMPSSTRVDYFGHKFTLEFSTYDNSATKYYVQYYNVTPASVASYSWFTCGNSITGGTMDSTQMPMTISDTSTAGAATQGTVLTVGNSFTPGTYTASSTSGFTTVRTFWCYITGKTMVWGTSNATSASNGWAGTYNDATKWSGPHIISQYTRYDYHNTDSNGIIPVLYTNPRTPGLGFGQQTDYNAAWNPEYTSNTTSIPMRVLNYVSAAPQLGTSWPIVYHPQIQHLVNGRNSNYQAWNSGLTLGAVTGATTTTYGSGVASTAAYRYPTADLTSTGFALLPLQWEAVYRGNYGGNASDQGGFYIFNGDYQPGDTFVLNNKIWMVWPMSYGYVDRIGIAVPKE